MCFRKRRKGKNVKLLKNDGNICWTNWVENAEERERVEKDGSYMTLKNATISYIFHNLFISEREEKGNVFFFDNKVACKVAKD